MAKSNKFGTFGGVFTPSILTILGVIMYLRLPMIIGEAGLWSTIGIIVVAHIISFATGISVSSIATDKKVQAGGTYYIISRSLGLPIGGTLGLSLFVGMSFSVSLYLIGFSESFLNYFDYEVTRNTIRIAGTLVLAAVTTITFISTSLAIKAQYFIMGAIGLSLLSIFFGVNHEFKPVSELVTAPGSTVPLMVLFGIFFPAVTGFEAGVSMSGDLKDPKVSIPRGTISAIIVGFVVYIGLTFFFSFTVDAEILKQKEVLTMISAFPVVVIIGIWGATLSSALGSILGAPRILQATAVDRITPRLFSKGVGASNEPRNALLLSFAIAEVGILVGELDVIARVVSIFFITTYGFLNLSAAFEAWSSADFRPSFKAPIWLSLLGAAACIIVMIQLDFLAMIGATVILGLVFLYLKRKELTLETGDAWSGVWASAVKTGLTKLSVEKIHHRNWRPNILLFSGDATVRRHLVELGTQISGSLGMLTSFELIPTTDSTLGKSPARKMDDNEQFFSVTHACHEVYAGMEEIVRVYGFSGIQPNTVLMGWSRKEPNREKFASLLKVIHKNDYNGLFLNYHTTRKYGKNETIDIWWNGSGRTLSLAINLIRYVTSNPVWAKASVRLMVVNENRSMTELINKRTKNIVDDFRIELDVHVIDNSLHMLKVGEIITQYSQHTDLTIIGLAEESIEAGPQIVQQVDSLLNTLGTTLIISASTGFQSLDIGLNEKDTVLPLPVHPQATLPDLKLSKYPVIAEGIRKLDTNGQKVLTLFFEKTIAPYYLEANRVFAELEELKDSTASRIGKVIDLDDRKRQLKLLAQIKENFYRQSHVIIERLVTQRTRSITETLETGIHWYTDRLFEDIKKVPQQLKVAYDPAEFTIQKDDAIGMRFYKLRKRFVKFLTGSKMVHMVHYREVAQHYLVDNRILFMVAYIREFETRSIDDLADHRQLLNMVADSLDTLIRKAESDELNAFLLEKELAQLNQHFDTSSKRIEKVKESSYNRLLIEYRINLQKMNDTLSRLTVNQRAEKFRKQRKAYRKKLEVLQAGAENWQQNLVWTANKVYAEMLIREIMSHAEEGLRNYEAFVRNWFDVHYYQPAAVLRDELTTLLNNQQAEVRLAVHFDPNQIAELTTQFLQRTNEINELITPLPDDITIIVEIGNDDQAESQDLPLRSMTSHFIESRLISTGEDHLEKVSENLRKSNFIIKDISNLVRFGLDNALKQDHVLHDEHFIKIIEESIQNLIQEENRIKELETGFTQALNEYFINSFEPLQPFRINASATEFYSFAREFRGKQVKSQLQEWSKQFIDWTKNLGARLLYSVSGGVLMAKKFTRVESNTSQSSKILDLVETVSPDAAVYEQLPFYYKNLFSGRSNIGNDFWVVRKNEEDAFQKALERYDQGLYGAIMILGNRNQGKTALAKFILAKFSRDRQIFHAFPPKEGGATATVFNTVLQKVTGFAGTTTEILEAVPHGSILHIHDMECWWERRSSGYEVISEMMQLINRYSHKCLFILSSNPYAYALINRILDIHHHFISVIECQPFTAEDLKNLILLRHKSSGLKFRIKGIPEDELSAFRTARIFNRYFEYALGNPGVALNGWLSNILSMQDKELEMRLPRNRTTAVLRNLDAGLLVVLSEVVLHKRLTQAALTRIMGLPSQEIEEQLYALLRMGLLYESAAGIYAINIYMEPFISQLLEERELL